MGKKQMSLEVVNPNAAGIDVGSKSHWVAIGQDAQDIKDCQWIQKLHCLGLLSHSFLPDSTTEIIRTYSRHRQNLIKQTGRTVLKVQKYLRLMNMRLNVVVNDVVGLTGTKIITAFIAGETKGETLAKYRHYNCRKPEEEIAKALQYNGRADYLFALKQEWETYLHIQKQISEVDVQIKKITRRYYRPR